MNQVIDGGYRDGSPIILSGLTTSAGIATLCRITNSPGDADHHKEDLLQEIIERSPEVLPILGIEPAFKGARAVCRELPVGDNLDKALGYIDNLLVTPNGAIVLVECKLIRNFESRRAVVAQVLGYIAAIAQWSYADLDNAVRVARKTTGLAAASLYELAGGATGDLDQSRFAEAVSRNLHHGNILALIVGDGISDIVRDITQFLTNRSTSRFSLGLVELEIFKLPGDGEPQYLVLPQVHARTVIVPITVRVVDGVVVDPPPGENGHPGQSASKRTTLTREMFFEALAEKAPDQVEAVRAFLETCEAAGCSIGAAESSLKILAPDSNGTDWVLAYLNKKGDVWIYNLGPKDRLNGTDVGQRYMDAVVKVVPNAIIKEHANASAAGDGNNIGYAWGREIKKEKGYLKISEMMAIGDQWGEIISSAAADIRRIGL